MPDFVYTARDTRGQAVAGKLSANSRHEALALLDSRALFPVKVEADTQPVVARLRGKRVKAQLVATTYGQLADLLRSGVPLLRSLRLLKEQASHAGLAEVLDQVHGQVEEGATLAEAMGRHPKVFGEMAISMVRAGGEGGFLEEALDRVAQFTEQQEDLKGRTIGAMAYPVFLAVVGFCVVTALIVFFVPKFNDLFQRLRERNELPAVTEWLLATSSWIRGWWWLMLLGVGFAVVAIRGQLQTLRGRLWRDRLKLRAPLVGPIFLHLAVARFCRVLGTLLHNGVPIIRSLEISRDAAGNRVLTEAIEKATENITAGQSLAAPLAASGQFPVAVVEMIAVAEEANNLEKVLIDVADGLERRTWRRLDLAVRLLEPLMLLVLASVVLVVVIALLLPVIKMGTTI